MAEGIPPAVASIITHSWRNGNKNIQKNMESRWRPARCAAGSLNPHPGLRPGWARCPPLAGSLARRSFSVHGHLAQRFSSAYFTKKKTDCFCSPFLFGGDKGSRTPDLLNAIQALSQLSYTPKWLRCFLDNDDIISQRLLFVNRFLKSFFKKFTCTKMSKQGIKHPFPLANSSNDTTDAGRQNQQNMPLFFYASTSPFSLK